MNQVQQSLRPSPALMSNHQGTCRNEIVQQTELHHVIIQSAISLWSIAPGPQCHIACHGLDKLSEQTFTEKPAGILS